MTILPSGRVVVVCDKFVRDDGHLVIVARYWSDEADFKANPDKPRAEFDHLITSKTPIDPTDPNVGPCIGAIFAAVDVANEKYSPASDGHERGNADPFGWLAHPHVSAIEVTA
jgi:hypothetical protein